MSKNGTTMSYDDLRLHECCELMRPMTDDEMEDLTENIRAVGLQKKIVLLGRMILDGRSRYIAMKNLGIKLGPEHFEQAPEGIEPFDLVAALNVHRRHLTASQRADWAVTLKRRMERQGQQHARGKAAKLMGVSEAYVAAAERVRERDPEASKKVAAGTTTLQRACRELDVPALENHRSKPKPAPKEQHRGIAEGLLVDVKRPEHPTRLEDVAQEYEERRASREDVPDQQWAEELPLASQLEGKIREALLRDAVAYRKADAARRAYAAAIGALVKSNRRSGPWLAAQEWALACLPPDDWERCPDKKEGGGCGGTGVAGAYGEQAKCGVCKGNGYLIR